MTGVCAVSVDSSGRYIIGNNGKLPWTCKNDMKWFNFITTGETIVMGRKTMESIGSKPLKCRKNIVLSRSLKLEPNGFELKRYIDDLPYESFIIGGSELLNQTMDIIDILFITYILGTHEGNCFIDNPVQKFSKHMLVKKFNDCHIWMFKK